MAGGDASGSVSVLSKLLTMISNDEREEVSFLWLSEGQTAKSFNSNFAGAVLGETVTLLIRGHMVARISQASARESHSSSTYVLP